MLTAQVETLAGGTLDELKPLFPGHYAELSRHQGRHALNPRYDAYLAKEAAGEVLCVTLRADGAIVGYLVGFVGPGLHYPSCLTCTPDIFYVHPDHRNAGAGRLLFKTAEAELRRRGVNLWMVGTKRHFDAGPLLERLGFAPEETMHWKWLD